jgi:hypothetical protein
LKITRLKIKHMLGTILIVIALSYLFLVGIVYLRQGSMLYYPIKEIGATPLNIGLNFEEIFLKTRDGINISAWYIPAENERGQGIANFEKANEPKEFLRITGGHNEGFLISGRDYIEGLNRFISRYF